MIWILGNVGVTTTAGLAVSGVVVVTHSMLEATTPNELLICGFSFEIGAWRENLMSLERSRTTSVCR
jgi:hypothetical protein